MLRNDSVKWRAFQLHIDNIVLLNGRKKIPKRRARAIHSVAMTIGRNHLFGHTFKDAAHVFWLLAEVGTYIVALRVIATDCIARARLLGIFFRPFNSRF